jgi:hypothetical protein
MGTVLVRFCLVSRLPSISTSLDSVRSVSIEGLVE